MRKTIASLKLVLVASVAFAGESAAPHPAAPHDAGPAETKEQKTHRTQYIQKTIKKEQEIVGHRAWTPEMNAAASAHWQKAYRAIRIRELAEDEHDTAATGRVDVFLTKLDEGFFRNLTALVADAPAIPPAPTLASPANNANVPIASAVTFKMNPVTGAKWYACSLYEPGGHYWSNYDPKAKQWGTSADCTIPATDARWDKFAAGKTHFIGRAVTPTKSKGGKDFNLWSDPVRIDVMLTAAGTK